jgi:cytochrome b6-f complex iron-sulfur subunit
MAGGGADRFVPDMQRRNLMNLILVSGTGLVIAWLGLPFLDFILLVTATYRASKATGGQAAMDKQGNKLTFEGWLKSHEAGERELVQGMKGDPTWIVTTAEKQVLDYAITAVCTHLGCTVPWNKQQNKYMCPCHGSQYDFSGKVIRGPAPLSLALVHVEDAGGVISLSKWTEQDFRTGLDPWWIK